jgi:hypothetical protein
MCNFIRKDLFFIGSYEPCPSKYNNTRQSSNVLVFYTKMPWGHSTCCDFAMSYHRTN